MKLNDTHIEVLTLVREWFLTGRNYTYYLCTNIDHALNFISQEKKWSVEEHEALTYQFAKAINVALLGRPTLMSYLYHYVPNVDVCSIGAYNIGWLSRVAWLDRMIETRELL